MLGSSPEKQVVKPPSPAPSDVTRLLRQWSEGDEEALNRLLPPHWSHGNPIDVLGDAGPDRYAGAIETAMADAGSDGLLVLLTPQAMTDATMTAEQLRPFAQRPGKPLLACWMGGSGVAAGRAILRQARIPTFNNPESAVRSFLYMWRYSYNIRALYETPALVLPDDLSAASEAARTLSYSSR